MEISKSKEIFSFIDNSEKANSSKLSNFKSYLKENFSKKSKEKSLSQKESENQTINIKLNNNLNSNEFDHNINLKENSSQENESNKNDIDNISLIEKENENEFFDINASLNYDLDLFSFLEKYNYLIENFDLNYIKKFKRSILKCLLGIKNSKDNNDCNCIPLIKLNKFSISFTCEHHSKEKNITINSLILMENIDKIFINSRRRINQKNNNINDYFDLMRKNIVKFELDSKNMKKKLKYFIFSLGGGLKEKINFLKNYLDDYKNNKINHDAKFKEQTLIRLKRIYSPFLQNLNLLIYAIILNALLSEFNNLLLLNFENTIKLLINLKNGKKIIEKNDDKFIYDKLIKICRKKKMKEKKKILKFSWIIEFYLEEEIKYEENKNIFIGINEKGIIAIFSINFFNNENSILTEDKKSIYNLIRTKTIESTKLIKITKLKKLINKQENDNYYILNSMSSDEFGKAVIINITENDNNIGINEKYEIKIIQYINDTNGLYSSIEFFYKEKVFLLNYNNDFYLWTYDSEKNKIVKLNYKNEIVDNEKSYSYGPLLYLDRKNLFIIQCFSNKSFIEFYNLIVEKDDKFNFIKIDKVVEFTEEESVLKSNNNFYFYKDKYLLLGSGKRKNNSLGGIYIIDLEKFKKIAFHTFPKCISINSLLPTKKNNLIIVSSVFNYKKFYLSKKKKPMKREENSYKSRTIDFNRGRLISLEINEEENNTISLQEFAHKEGSTFYFINCQKLFFDEYLFTSIYKNNSLIKLLSNGKFNHYCLINN